MQKVAGDAKNGSARSGKRWCVKSVLLRWAGVMVGGICHFAHLG